MYSINAYSDFEDVETSGDGELVLHVESGAANGDSPERECSDCGATFYWDGSGWDGEHDAECEEGIDETPPALIDEINGAHVWADQDAVTVSISVGDPRGGFVMRIERIMLDDGSHELRLSVPSDQDGMPHMNLEPLASPGYYRVRS